MNSIPAMREAAKARKRETALEFLFRVFVFSWPKLWSMGAMVTWRPMPQRTDAAHNAGAPASVRCFVLTVSDTRTRETDSSGAAIADLLTAAGHVVAGRTIVTDDAELVRETIVRQLATPDVPAIITTGGTGITSRDSTYEAIAGLLQK